ncbi:phosphatase PAP2 family protein [Altererythrobacter aquiaggeris]|uniref:phosphatase PAP2 family protein n=1 Tax=Aestuarierythrobacter aquiaggeris TaxID=1898396 RepID=UPI0030179E2C
MSTRAAPSNLYAGFVTNLLQSAAARKLLVLTIVFVLSVSMLTTIVLQTGLVIQISQFAWFLQIAAALFLLSVWCFARHDDFRLAHAAIITAVATISLMLCGLVSNTGLRLKMPVADDRLAAMDAMLGLDMADAVVLTAQTPWLSDLLAFAYNWSSLAVVAAIVGLLAFKQIRRSWELTLTVVVAMQMVAVISVFFPAKGTAFFFDLAYLQGNGIPVGAAVYAGDTFDRFYHGSDLLVGLADLNGVVVFPSFHTVLALLATQALWNGPARILAVMWTALVIVSTVPMGGHYVVDLAAGVVVWISAYTVATWAEYGPAGRSAVNSPSG